VAHEETKPGAERRRFPRLRESCSIRVKPIAGASPPREGMDAMAVNISGGGLRFKSPEPVSVGDFLAVEMNLPDFSSPIVAMARAVFSERTAEGYEVGVDFWWVGWGDDSAQRAISDYIKTELRQRDPRTS
jgi:hypothetical protein